MLPTPPARRLPIRRLGLLAALVLTSLACDKSINEVRAPAPAQSQLASANH